jgi:hypothetical protein
MAPECVTSLLLTVFFTCRVPGTGSGYSVRHVDGTVVKKIREFVEIFFLNINNTYKLDEVWL